MLTDVLVDNRRYLGDCLSTRPNSTVDAHTLQECRRRFHVLVVAAVEVSVGPAT